MQLDQCLNAAQCGYDYLCDTVTHKCYPPKDCFAALERSLSTPGELGTP